MSDAPVRPPWSRSDRMIPRTVLRPLQAFVEAETAGGLVLLGAVVVALVSANGPWAAGYERMWAAVVGVRIGRWGVSEPLRQWVGEGLMTVFFLAVALEIKRELLTGELRDRRTAVLPVLAAFGGMILPAIVFLAIDGTRAGSKGWGIAMPTDIAFALGVLALSARRAPAGLKAFLLALAIVDDLASIVVVAVFYSHTVRWSSLLIAALLGLLVLLLQRVRIRATSAYAALGVAMWLALHGSGVSPTLAGVALGFLTPAVAFHRPRFVSEEAHRVADETVDEPHPPDADAAQWLHLAGLSREAVSPLARLETVLRPLAVFVVVPLFALANAGVVLSLPALGAVVHSRLALAIMGGRLIGKTFGIALSIAAALRLGLGRLPSGVRPVHVIGMSAAAGIPFTVSIFIAELSLSPALVEVAKLAILLAGAASAAIAFAILRRGYPRGVPR
jgi:Na+:H+ antiporter, NhaA family